MAVKKKNSEEKMIDEAIALLRVCGCCWQDPTRLTEIQTALELYNKKTMPAFLKKNFMATTVGSDWMTTHGTTVFSCAGLMIYNLVQKTNAEELENFTLVAMEKNKFYQTLLGGALIRLASRKATLSENEEDSAFIKQITGMSEKYFSAANKLLAKVKAGSEMDEAISALTVAATVSLGYMPG